MRSSARAPVWRDVNAVRAVEEPFGYDQQVWVSFDENAGVLLKD